MRNQSNSFLENKSRQSGNAMVYVLIVVVLFAAISFVVSRQTDNSETGVLSAESIEIHASSIQQEAYQFQQSIDQMTYTGTRIDTLDFVTPDDEPAFSAGTSSDHVHKVFHPEGGGLSMPKLSEDAVDQSSTDPIAGWYVGAFNNVEWTPTSSSDVILTAHQIKQEICAKINEKLTNSSVIPELSADANVLLIDHSHSTANNNLEFTSATCAGCYGKPSLCVKSNGANRWTFYSIISSR